jgi:hypothetical protein
MVRTVPAHDDDVVVARPDRCPSTDDHGARLPSSGPAIAMIAPRS